MVLTKSHKVRPNTKYFEETYRFCPPNLLHNLLNPAIKIFSLNQRFIPIVSKVSKIMPAKGLKFNFDRLQYMFRLYFNVASVTTLQIRLRARAKENNVAHKREVKIGLN